MNSYVLTLCCSLLGAILFYVCHIPVPFLLGPMLTMLILTQFTSIRFKWPKKIRNYCLMIIGYTLGSAFTLPILKSMVHHIPSMLVTTLLLFAISLLFSWLLTKFGKVDYPTALTSSVPGGLTQIIALAEQLKGINITVVAFFHTIRVIMIVLLVPLIVHIPAIEQAVTNPTALIPLAEDRFNLPFVIKLLLYIVVCYAVFWLFKKWKVPAPTILGPIVGTIIVSCFIGISAITLPNWFMASCQLVIGTHIGLLLNPTHLPRKKVVVPLSIMSCVTLIATAFLLSATWMPWVEQTAIATGFLSLAPGGVDQMGIIGHEIGADLSMITMYQVFRMLFVYFIVPPLITVAIRRYNIKKRLRQNPSQ